MLKIAIVIAGDSLEVEGDVTFPDARALVDAWFLSVARGDQVTLDALVARGNDANQKLQAVITATGLSLVPLPLTGVPHAPP